MWWRHLGRDRPLHLVACREPSGGVVAILPCYLARSRPARTLRFVGHGPADRLAPICAPADRGRAAAAALRSALDDRIGWHVAVADRLPGEECWADALGENRSAPSPARCSSPRARDWDAFVASRSKNFREQVRRRERKLARAHELRYRLTQDPGELEDDYETLVRLHRARWGDDSSSFIPPRDALHRDFAAAALGAAGSACGPSSWTAALWLRGSGTA